MVGFERIISDITNNIKGEDLVRINIKQNKTKQKMGLYLWPVKTKTTFRGKVEVKSKALKEWCVIIQGLIGGGGREEIPLLKGQRD